jgi:hypothetical protein
MKRGQIFAATAAYAAVLVVFVSGNLAVFPTVDNSIIRPRIITINT